jgi:hypothetical protein
MYFPKSLIKAAPSSVAVASSIPCGFLAAISEKPFSFTVKQPLLATSASSSNKGIHLFILVIFPLLRGHRRAYVHQALQRIHNARDGFHGCDEFCYHLSSLASAPDAFAAPRLWEYPKLANAAAMKATAFSAPETPSGVITPEAYRMPQIVAAVANQNSVVLYPLFIILYLLLGFLFSG